MLRAVQCEQCLHHLLRERVGELGHGLAAEVAATDGPLVVLLLEDGTDQAEQ